MVLAPAKIANAAVPSDEPTAANPAMSEITPQQAVSPSKDDKASALLTFKSWFKGDATHSDNWRRQAREDFDFVAGDQWTIEDKQILKGQSRPIITFNRSLTIVKAVAGMEINGRHEISFIPRNTTETAVNEVLTGASKWMADESDAEDEESDAFQNALICGMGWTEHRMDYLEDPKGMYVEESIDPLEMYWDRTARKKNLSDARRLWRVRKMPVGDATEQFPGFSADQMDASWAHADQPETPIKTLEERRIRDENTWGVRSEQDEVTIVQCQWWEVERYYLVADPQTGQKTELSGENYDKLKARLAELEGKLKIKLPLLAVPMKRKVFKRAFLGNEVLEMSDNADPERFTWTCITGEKHHNKRTWFGIIRMLRDPQMWANKWLSQTLHILNATAKGGLLAETGAFEDQRQAEENYAKPEGIVWMARDALSGQKPRVMPKPGQGNPEAYVEMLTVAVNATRDVSGINLELLGQKDVNQPGILEAQRKQAGMTVLATMFDALRRMRKQVGRIRLYFIQTFLSDGRMIRIVGPEGAKAVPLIRDKCLGEYDTIVDDTPTSPNQKQANWAIILSLLQVFGDYLKAKPQLLPLILEYSPLPAALVDAIKNAITSPDPNDAQNQQLAIAAQVAKISKDQAQAELFNKQAGATEATAMYDEAMARNLLMKHQGDMAAAFNDARQSGLQAAKLAADTLATAAKADQTKAQTEKTRAETAGQHADTLSTHVDTARQALTPIQHGEPIGGAPGQPQVSLQ